jgi:hypothetical protein
MMSVDSKIDMALMRIVADSRATVWHISLYTAILHNWYENDFKTPFYISRRQLMDFAHIGSIATYHKCIKQLTDFGYISYFPSYNPYVGTAIFLEID